MAAVFALYTLKLKVAAFTYQTASLDPAKSSPYVLAGQRYRIGNQAARVPASLGATVCGTGSCTDSTSS